VPETHCGFGLDLLFFLFCRLCFVLELAADIPGLIVLKRTHVVLDVVAKINNLGRHLFAGYSEFLGQLMDSDFSHACL